MIPELSVPYIMDEVDENVILHTDNQSNCEL